MSDAKRIEDLKNRVQKALKLNDTEIQNWWETPSPVFNYKSPETMTKNEADFKKLELIIKFSSHYLLKNMGNGGEVNHP